MPARLPGHPCRRTGRQRGGGPGPAGWKPRGRESGSPRPRRVPAAAGGQRRGAGSPRNRRSSGAGGAGPFNQSQRQKHPAAPPPSVGRQTAKGVVGANGGQSLGGGRAAKRTGRLRGCSGRRAAARLGELGARPAEPAAAEGTLGGVGREHGFCGRAEGGMSGLPLGRRPRGSAGGCSSGLLRGARRTTARNNAGA